LRHRAGLYPTNRPPGSGARHTCFRRAPGDNLGITDAPAAVADHFNVMQVPPHAMKSNPRIVVDGIRRLRGSKEYGAVRTRLLSEARARHTEEIKVASFWRRIWLNLKIEREVRAELNKMCPPGALYAVGKSQIDVHNQLPDPTTPSVTPPAGAGVAPSVAADH
jgi:hypothetical protein